MLCQPLRYEGVCTAAAASHCCQHRYDHPTHDARCNFAGAHPVTCDRPEEPAPLARAAYHRHELPRARTCRYTQLGKLLPGHDSFEWLTSAELTIRDHPVRKHAFVLEEPPGTTPRKSLSTLTVAQRLCTSERPPPAFHRKRGRMAPLARSPRPSRTIVQPPRTIRHRRPPPNPSSSAR
jgi:hypothetical protein